MTTEHKEYDGREISATHLGLTGKAWVTHAWADWYYIHVKGTWANGNAADGIYCREQAPTVARYLIGDAKPPTDFAQLGRAHAAEAIDQIDAYDDARGSYRDNLGDTLAEQHPHATANQIGIAFDAYDAAWDAHDAVTR